MMYLLGFIPLAFAKGAAVSPAFDVEKTQKNIGPPGEGWPLRGVLIPSSVNADVFQVFPPLSLPAC